MSTCKRLNFEFLANPRKLSIALLVVLSGILVSCQVPEGTSQALKNTVPGCSSNGDGIENNPHCTGNVLPVNDPLLAPTFSKMGQNVSDAMPFGARMAFVNFTNDGFTDLAVYSRNFINGVADGSTANVIVYSGKDHSILHTFTGNYFFGRSISSAGDFNNDGFDDLIIGAPTSPGNGVAGAAYVYSGKDHSLIYSMVGAVNSLVGWVVASAGDVNEDGFDEVLIADPSYSNKRGIVYIISGKDHSILNSMIGENAGDSFGQSASPAGDIDGDGLPDIVVGTRDFGSQLSGTQLTGKIYVYSPASGQLLWSKLGTATEGLGIGVSSAGDFNHDSVPDLLVQSGISNSIKVLSGKDGSALYQQNQVASYYFGLNAAPAGDIDHDGYADVAFGNWRTGNVQIVSGKSASVILTIIPNPQDVMGTLGGFVVSGANFNGDGQQNLALAAINARNSLTDGNPRGKIYVISAAGAIR